MPQLVLTRQEGEEIVIIDTIGNEIARVRVARIRGDKVRLAVEASLRYGVHRAEVYEAIRAEKAAELARAQGFPEDYILPVVKSRAVKFIGNSVAPPVVEALVRANVGRAKRRTRKGMREVLA